MPRIAALKPPTLRPSGSEGGGYLMHTKPSHAHSHALYLRCNGWSRSLEFFNLCGRKAGVLCDSFHGHAIGFHL